MKKVNSILPTLAVLLFITGTVPTQTQNPASSDIEHHLVVRSNAGITAVVPSMFEPIATGGLLDDVLVKNKPFAAVFESETVQTLANGASKRRVATKVYRDKDGRTRREQIVYPNGTTPTNTAAPIISVYDPVAHFGYAINSTTRTAERRKLPLDLLPGAPFDNKIPLSIEILRSGNSPNGTAQKYTLETPILLPLGKQTIAGVQADGWRVTIKVPAGALGNAGPIESVYEMWLALDLGMMVKFSAKNPVSGEHTLLLKSISRAEQSRALFEVPTEYKLSEMGVRRTDLAPPR